ncbi:N-acetyltransferase [cyanobacterium endosymbiont of Rhopalodia gibberula]|uniref:GNAT family N-acetyltransferase n=1 Tax=cyanobacterium endosymbiont of Rhopalodia gibberula TaxID=1763363 RepID=UPI000DC719F8|nr:GNAT family N-acetyltransferase [cyanobacterium endosymbiont of Rhopalodia gibberula]BBA78695.1 N-acetyltransferase [cyanobacterium endosymbiont of Rhopalodia gibberula]
MVFWKRLFSNSSDSVTSALNSNFKGEFLDIEGETNSQRRIFLSTERDINLYELEELCDAVGWARRPLRKVKQALNHSFLVVSMWEVEKNQRRLVGFARATSDHAFNATVWDVVVHPSCQNKGLGKALIKYMIHQLRNKDISNITLFADPQVIDFYRRLGFVLDPEGIKGMFWYPN